MTMGLNGRCEVCRRPYEFGTDGCGNVWYAHPPLPCVEPKPTGKYAWIPCKICGKQFDPTPLRGGPFRKICHEPGCKRAQDTQHQAALRSKFGSKYVRKDVRERYYREQEERRLAALVRDAHAQWEAGNR